MHINLALIKLNYTITVSSNSIQTQLCIYTERGREKQRERRAGKREKERDKRKRERDGEKES